MTKTTPMAHHFQTKKSIHLQHTRIEAQTQCTQNYWKHKHIIKMHTSKGGVEISNHQKWLDGVWDPSTK